MTNPIIVRPWFRSALRVTGAAAALLLLLWSVAVPSLRGAHPPGWRPDEGCAVANLRIVAAAQQAFRQRLGKDRDGDGKGEFGWFDELADHEPPQLTLAFRKVENGLVRRGGYLLQLWLPTADGSWISQGSQHGVDPDAAEARFWVYAWPSSTSRGRRAFFVDAAGVVYSTPNVDRRYCDVECPVPVDAALPSSEARGDAPADGRIGRDGAVWSVVH